MKKETMNRAETVEAGKESLKIYSEKVKMLTDEELDKIVGGSLRNPSPNVRCEYVNNHCYCPKDD